MEAIEFEMLQGPTNASLKAGPAVQTQQILRRQVAGSSTRLGGQLGGGDAGALHVVLKQVVQRVSDSDILY